MSRFRGSPAQLWISTAVRVGLAAVLFWSGGAKLTEPQQAVMAVQAYEILPTRVGEFVGYALPLMELALAVALLVGVATRLTAIVAGALMTAFVIGVASAWARGLSIDCGCFGGGGAVPEGEANYLPVLLRDFGFALMAGWLVCFPASRLAIDLAGRAGTGDLGLYDEWEDDGQSEPARSESSQSESAQSESQSESQEHTEPEQEQEQPR